MKLTKAAQIYLCVVVATTGIYLGCYTASQSRPDSTFLAFVANNTEQMAMITIAPVAVTTSIPFQIIRDRERIWAYARGWIEKIDRMLSTILKFIKKGLTDVLWPDIVKACEAVYDLLLVPFARLLGDTFWLVIYSVISLVQGACVIVGTVASLAWQVVVSIAIGVSRLVLEPLQALLVRCNQQVEQMMQRYM
jgi:hypothetical protein